MIVDTSAVVAVLKEEPEAGRFLRDLNGLGAAQAHVGGQLSGGRHRRGRQSQSASVSAFGRLDRSERKSSSSRSPSEQAEIARAAYRDFGKGSGHAAGLNFGDCFAYALAKSMREPLLFKGDDFSHTDVAIA